jgi:hypothetical protein
MSKAQKGNKEKKKPKVDKNRETDPSVAPPYDGR